MTRRARGDPTAQRGELERLWEVAQGEAVLAQLRLQRGARRPALDARRAGDRVELQHAVEHAQVDRHRAVVGGTHARRDPTHHRGAAAVGNRGDALAGAPLEQAFEVLLIARAGD